MCTASATFCTLPSRKLQVIRAARVMLRRSTQWHDGGQSSLFKLASGPVLIVQGDRLALISTAEHVIERADVLYPEGTGHHSTVPRKSTGGQGEADPPEEFK